MKKRYSLVITLAFVISASMWSVGFENSYTSKQLEAKVPSQGTSKHHNSVMLPDIIPA